MATSNEDKIAILIKKYDCAVSFLRKNEQPISYRWDRWSLHLDKDYRYKYTPNKTGNNPFALFLVNNIFSKSIFGESRNRSYFNKLLYNYHPLLEIDKKYGVHGFDAYATALYRGMQIDSINSYIDCNEGPKIFNYNCYNFCFYLGRFLLDKYYGHNFEYPKISVFK